jgi:GH24 family phage-related lysozyme (muramidase)
VNWVDLWGLSPSDWDSYSYIVEEPELVITATRSQEGDFSTLPGPAKTALFDMTYQLGSVPESIMKAVGEGNYSKAATLIENHGQTNGYANRRNAEAALLKQLPN